MDDLTLPTQFHVGGEVPDKTDDDKTLEQIQKWYTQCSGSHYNCRTDNSIGLPTRLLDIQAPDSLSGIRLIETECDLPTPDIEYACLSHCWGKSRPRCINLKESLEQKKQQINWHDVPLTFQQSIETLRALGFRYLWIDSICIIQDDSSDWEREARSMCDVYTGASLTLAATNSPNSQNGLYSSRSGEYRSMSFTLRL